MILTGTEKERKTGRKEGRKYKRWDETFITTVIEFIVSIFFISSFGFSYTNLLLKLKKETIYKSKDQCMLVKTRRLQLLDLIFGSKTTAIVSIVNWFELENLKNYDRRRANSLPKRP